MILIVNALFLADLFKSEMSQEDNKVLNDYLDKIWGTKSDERDPETQASHATADTVTPCPFSNDSIPPYQPKPSNSPTESYNAASWHEKQDKEATYEEAKMYEVYYSAKFNPHYDNFSTEAQTQPGFENHDQSAMSRSGTYHGFNLEKEGKNGNWE